jgi:Na+-transporting methylmalonyl-CoA/oxaloacetate decarboxylase gamma subunit
MTLLAVTADTWIVTGLGFGIVLALLFCLVFIMQFFGWTMQKATAPKASKTEVKKEEPKEEKKTVIPEAPKPAPTPSPDDDIAAIAFALYLASCNTKHDAPTSMIKPQARETAWNTKSIGMNNQGF